MNFQFSQHFLGKRLVFSLMCVFGALYALYVNDQLAVNMCTFGSFLLPRKSVCYFLRALGCFAVHLEFRCLDVSQSSAHDVFVIG